MPRTASVAEPPASVETVPVGLWQFYAYFLRLGATGFGGPIALAGFMQRDLVEERRWIGRQDYLDGLALAQLAPGPLAAQLAMYLGYVRAGTLGATIVSVCFILPSFLMVWTISVGYLVGGPWGMIVAALGVFLLVYLFVVLPAPYFRRHRSQPVIKGFVEGVSAAATGAIAGAAYVLATRALDRWTAGIAIVTFVILTRWKVSELWLIGAEGAFGLIVRPLAFGSLP